MARDGANMDISSALVVLSRTPLNKVIGMLVIEGRERGRGGEREGERERERSKRNASCRKWGGREG